MLTIYSYRVTFISKNSSNVYYLPLNCKYVNIKILFSVFANYINVEEFKEYYTLYVPVFGYINFNKPKSFSVYRAMRGYKFASSIRSKWYKITT